MLSVTHLGSLHMEVLARYYTLGQSSHGGSLLSFTHLGSFYMEATCSVIPT